MSKKMFLLFALIFSMVGYVNAEESVEAAEIAETEEVAPGNKKEEAAEINEIDAVEKVKEADADKEITIKDGTAKEVAEDVAEGKEEAELAAKNAENEIVEPVVEDNKSGSSWFSWMWPFSSSTKDEVAEEDEEDGEEALKEDKEEVAEIKEIDADEKVKEADVDKEIVIKDETAKDVAEDKEEAEVVVAENTEDEIVEPVVEDNKSDSSWFSWMWPFSSSAKEEVAEESPKEEEEAVEIKGINPVEKVKEADKDEVAKDVAEDKEEAEIIVAENGEDEVVEPVVEDNKDDASWFAWMWPFSSSTKEEVAEEAPKEGGEVVEVADVVEVAVDDEGNKKVEEVVVVEDAKGDVVVEDVEVVESADGEVVAVKEDVVEGEPVEPAVEVAVDTGKCGEGGSCFMRKVLLYIPNILVNLTDVISCGAAVGAEAGVEFRITRYFQFGGQYGESAFIEKAYKRVYGGGIDNGYNFQLAALASENRYIDNTFGGVKPYIDDVPKAVINSPEDLLYKNGTRDFWAIGVDAGWLVNVRFDIHPTEFVDFLASIIALDITGDNIK